MDIKVPEVGESIFEAVIAAWHKKDGEAVTKDELLCELETDKINVELSAEASGTLSIREAEGATVKIGSIIGVIDEAGAPKTAEVEARKPSREKAGPRKAQAAEPAARPAEAAVNPAARKLAREKGVDLADVAGSGKGGRVTVEDVQKKEAAPEKAPPEAPTARADEREAGEERVTRKPMSPLRKKIAERLVAVRQQAAMLTTFNEADMSRVLALRAKHQEHFQKKHGVKLGLMSFFVKAGIEALKAFPEVNARIEGDDIVYQHFYDIGIAVGSEKGLVVPVLRDAERLTFAEIEKAIAEMAQRVKERRITLGELEGGTFTISNGGVYGSLLSTPMLNPPQSGVLGMHAIVERPVAREGEVVIRPMMNLALSYDHRIIDGREAVGFLRRIKECIEEPEEMLLEL